jgi:hypothetical protein
MIGKGRRSPEVKASMLEHGCVYFGAVEGHAALLAQCIARAEVFAYEDLVQKRSGGLRSWTSQPWWSMTCTGTICMRKRRCKWRRLNR